MAVLSVIEEVCCWVNLLLYSYLCLYLWVDVVNFGF